MPSLTIPTIPELNHARATEAKQRQDRLTKPPGALGRLEEISIRLAAITGVLTPELTPRAVVVCAGDHGVAAQGVSAYPQEVTGQMVMNFLFGGAGINVLGRHMNADVLVVDAGCIAEFDAHPQLIRGKIAPGTQDMTQGPAMTRVEAEAALAFGIEIAKQQVEKGIRLLATGEMGIANTTPASAITAVLTGSPAYEVTGRGTGVDDERLQHKIAVVENAIEVNQPDASDGLDVLQKVGGLEIGVMAGILLGAASQRIPVVIDGFISTSAALIASAIAPSVVDYLFAGHRSVEPGHQKALAQLGLQPILDLGFRLGEGTGAVLAFGILDASVKILAEMATFEEAGVSEG